MENPTSQGEQVAAKIERKAGRFVIRAVMILLPLFVLDYFSPLFWFHRRSEIEREFPVQVVRHPEPYTMFGGVPNGRLGEEFVLNGRGYRGNEPAMPKPPGEFRVFVLGGSTVFLGDPAISDCVERKCHDRGYADIRLYNCGVVSSVSGMELSRIVFEIADLEPDLIVMYNGGNDVLHPYRYDPRPGYPFNFIAFESNPLLESDVRSYPTWSLLLYGSNLARSFFPHFFVRRFVPMKQQRRQAGWGTPEWQERIARAYVANLAKADAVSRAFGARFIAFFQPLVFYKDLRSTEEDSYRPDPKLAEHCLAVRRHVLEQVRQMEPLPFVDLSDLYDGSATTVFTDYIHTSQDGMEVVAGAVCDHVCRTFDAERPERRDHAASSQ